MKAAETRTITWRGRRITAQVPHPIATQDLGIRDATATNCASTSARLLVAAEIVPADFANLTHLLARNEALASSYIEGVRAPAIDSVLPALDGVARSIHDAIATVRFVREAADRDLSVEMLLDWHSRLMRSTPLAAEHIGSFRTEQGWIGGASPIDAELATSARAALSALETLASCGVLEEHSRPIGKGRPRRLFVSPELLALVDVGQ